MFSTSDTIIAIATPPGRGAIGIVRLSGPASHAIAASLTAHPRPFSPRHATLATLGVSGIRDHVVVTFFPGPASYTGDDVVEISAHGGGVILKSILEAGMAAGARLAAPGEFTLRAYLNGKIDLAQAEAVADLIDAVTPLQARAAFDQLNGTLTTAVVRLEEELFDLIARLEASIDFPEEGYHFVEPGATVDAIQGLVRQIDRLLSSAQRGRLIREGAQVAIVGRRNAGKSSLFNALVGSHRAIVTDIPGTTRDLLTEIVDLNGLRVSLVDTAGLGDTDDPVEQEGMRRAREVVTVADVVLLVCDGSVDRSSVGEWIQQFEFKVIVVRSKADLESAWDADDAVAVSVVSGEGLDALVARIHHMLGAERRNEDEVPMVSNVRHIELMTRARELLTNASQALEASAGALSEEFVLVDLQQARRLLEDVRGPRTADDLLAHVFSRFCVGK